MFVVRKINTLPRSYALYFVMDALKIDCSLDTPKTLGSHFNIWKKKSFRRLIETRNVIWKIFSLNLFAFTVIIYLLARLVNQLFSIETEKSSEKPKIAYDQWNTKDKLVFSVHCSLIYRWEMKMFAFIYVYTTPHNASHTSYISIYLYICIYFTYLPTSNIWLTLLFGVSK